MRFFKIRAVIVLIGIITLLGFFAVAVSVRISISMMDKRNEQIKEQESSKAKAAAAPKSEVLPDMAEVERIPLYFNGESRQEQRLFSDKEGHAWIPFDILLEQVGIPFRLFSGDDTVKARIGGKLLLLKLGGREAVLSGEPLELSAASTAVENRILVSQELPEKLPGFEPAIYAGSAGVFLNYWPESAWKPFYSTRLLKMAGGSLDFSDLQGGHPFAYGRGGPGEIAGIRLSQAAGGYILRSGDSIYLMKKADYRKVQKLDVSAKATLSENGDVLYWTSKSRRTLYIHDLKAGITRKHKNYFTRIKGKDTANPGFFLLKSYGRGERFARFEFQGSGGGEFFPVSGEKETHTLLERNGKVVIQGPSVYSPDHRKLLFYSSTKGYCVANSDGTRIVSLGSLKDASWIDNHRIFYRTETGKGLYDADKKIKTPVKPDWKFVGTALDGSVFYTVGNDLYVSAGGKDRLRMKLPWACDLVSAVSGSGSLMAVSTEKDSVFYISDKMTHLVGRLSAFPHSPGKGTPDAVFSGNTSINPNGSRIAMLQKGKAFLELKLVDTKKHKVKTITLNALLSEITNDTEIRAVWIDTNRLILVFHREGWLLDLSKGTRLHHWNVKEGETILDILKQPA